MSGPKRSSQGGDQTYCDRRCDCDYIALLDQKLAGFVAEFADLGFWDRSTCPQLSDCSIMRVSASGSLHERCVVEDKLVEVAHPRSKYPKSDVCALVV